MAIDYSTKIGFAFSDAGGQEKPDINYYILLYHWGSAEILTMRKNRTSFSLEYSPSEEKIISLTLEDASEKYGIHYDRTSMHYIPQPELSAQKVEDILQFAIKKFKEIKEKYGLEEKIRQHDNAAKAKDILSSF